MLRMSKMQSTSRHRESVFAKVNMQQKSNTESISEQSQTPKMRIVVNFANTQKEGERTFQTLSKACQNFLNIDLVLGGILHQDSAVKECIKAQIPLLTSYMNTIIAKDVIDLAKQLMQEK